MINDSLPTKKLTLVSTQQSQNSHSAKNSQIDPQENIKMKENSRKMIKGKESDEGYTLRTEEEDNGVEENMHGDNVKINAHANCNVNDQYSEQGIVLYSQDDEQYDDYQEGNNIDVQFSEQSYITNNNEILGFYQQDSLAIDFTPQAFLNLQISQYQPSVNGKNNIQVPSNKIRSDYPSYNDTISYLEDMLGSTYLDGLISKSITHTQSQIDLPPKIQYTAAYLEKQFSSKVKQLSSKTKQLSSKVKPNEIKPQSKSKPLTNQQSQKKSHKPVNSIVNKSQNVQCIHNNQDKKIKNNVQITHKNDDKFKKQKIVQNKQQKQQQSASNKASSTSNSHESSLEMPLKKRKQAYKNTDGKQKNEEIIRNFLHSDNLNSNLLHDNPNPAHQPKQQELNHKKFLEDEMMTKNYKGHEQKNHKQKKNYVQKDKQRIHQQINGWLYPDRGNVMYDCRVRPWVMKAQLTQQERYYQDLMKRQYITSYQRQALKSYIHQINNNRFTPPPYLPPFALIDQNSNQPYYNNARIPYQNNYYHHQQNNLNDFQKTPINNVQHVLSSSNSMSTKTMAKKQYNHGTYGQQQSSQIHQQQQKQSKRQNLVQVNKTQHQPQQNYQNVLPPNIFETTKTSPPVALIKQMSKANNKSQVFVLYDVPVIVSNQNISSLSADIFLLPYCKAMLIDKVPSKWIKCLEKMTGINILQKLDEMNQREIKENGREIADGTLNRIKISQKSGVKLNFNTLYLAKLTTLVDEGSKNPFGQRLLRSVMDKVIQNMISGISNRSSTGRTQRSLLIHGGFFPGVKRQDTPRLISYYLSLALANSSLEYKRTGFKPNKIYINVTKEEEYEVYIKEMRKIQLEYRKLLNF